MKLLSSQTATKSRPGKHFVMQNGRKVLAISWTTTLLLGAVLFTGCKKQQSVEEPASPTVAATAPTDEQLSTAIKGRITAQSALEGQTIQVDVSNGVATLSGAAKDEASRALAADEAGQVSGVRTVINNLTTSTAASTIEPAPQPAPKPESEPRPSHHESHAAKTAPKPRPGAGSPPKTTALATQPPAPIVSAAPVAPPAPPKPTSKTITLDSGTTLAIRTTEELKTGVVNTNDAFHGVLPADIIQDGWVVIPHGSQVTGRVVDAKDATHFKGSSELSIELTGVNVFGNNVALVTDAYQQQGKGRGKSTAVKTGTGAALGAIIGGLAGGGRGAAIGAAAGGGTGAGINAITRGEQVVIPSETLINFRLQSPITITTKQRAGNGNTDSVDPKLQERNY